MGDSVEKISDEVKQLLNKVSADSMHTESVVSTATVHFMCASYGDITFSETGLDIGLVTKITREGYESEATLGYIKETCRQFSNFLRGDDERNGLFSFHTFMVDLPDDVEAHRYIICVPEKPYRERVSLLMDFIRNHYHEIIHESKILLY